MNISKGGIIDQSWRSGKKFFMKIDPKALLWHDVEFDLNKYEKLQSTSNCTHQQQFYDCQALR